MRRLVEIALIVIVLGAGAGAEAQTRYVSDSIVITFRSGPSTDNAVTRNLTSGDRVELLEELTEEGYSRVRLEDGAEGWVLSRYLQPEPTAARRLAAAEADLASARARAAELEQGAAELDSELQATAEALGAAESRADRLGAELADVRRASAEALETRARNEELELQIARLRSEAAMAEIDDSRRRERQNWFIVGAAVLFGGIVIGLVAPSLRPKRKSSW